MLSHAPFPVSPLPSEPHYATTPSETIMLLQSTVVDSTNTPRVMPSIPLTLAPPYVSKSVSLLRIIGHTISLAGIDTPTPSA